MIKHAYVATGVNDDTKQVSKNRWNEDHVIDTELDIPVVASSAPPADGMLSIYAKKVGGRTMLMQMGPSGLDTAFQPNLGGNKVALWMPPGNGTTVPGVFGMVALTAVGTATARNVATTNMLTRMTRLGYVSAATAGSMASVREAAAKYTLGAGVGLGGFFYRVRFGVSDAATVAGARMFVGLSASTAAATNVEPNTLTNAIGVCQLSTSNNLHFYCAGSTATTAIDLGASFPANRLSLDVYELALFAPDIGGEVNYTVTRMNTGDVASGKITTNLPFGTQLLCHQIWRTNNATASAVGIDICGIYMETDY